MKFSFVPFPRGFVRLHQMMNTFPHIFWPHLKEVFLGGVSYPAKHFFSSIVMPTICACLSVIRKQEFRKEVIGNRRTTSHTYPSCVVFAVVCFSCLFFLSYLRNPAVNTLKFCLGFRYLDIGLSVLLVRGQNIFLASIAGIP